jgi:hypothetical protein
MLLAMRRLIPSQTDTVTGQALVTGRAFVVARTGRRGVDDAALTLDDEKPIVAL